MEGEQNILDAIFEDDNVEDGDDVEMLDVEEGELVEEELNNCSQNGSAQSSGGNASVANQEQQSQSKKKNKKRKKNKRKNNRFPNANVTDIDRFVMDMCRRLKERKSYLVYTAVGCLGVAALGDLIKEVDAIQACGGQMTCDGRRPRYGGGVLWSIIKAREPKAYKEIMKKAKDFEKQFKPRYTRQPVQQRKEGPSQVIANVSSEDGTSANVSDSLPVICQMHTETNQSNPEGKHISVHDRLRVPVSYDDDLLGGAPKDDLLEC